MRLKVIFLTWFLANFAFGQGEIKWSGAYDKVSSRALITATLADGWHVYSMHVDEMVGPVATKIELVETSGIVEISAVAEPEPIAAFDENFEAEVLYFEKSVTFEQELSIEDVSSLEYVVTFMLCNDVMCLPPVDEIVKISITN